MFKSFAAAGMLQQSDKEKKRSDVSEFDLEELSSVRTILWKKSCLPFVSR